jgi:hypothetical protein
LKTTYLQVGITANQEETIMANENSRKPFRLDPSQEEKPFFRETTTYVKGQSVFCKVHHVAMLLSEGIDTGLEEGWVNIEESDALKKEREDMEEVSDELFPNNTDQILDPPSGCRPMGGVIPAYLYCPECEKAKLLWKEEREKRLIEKDIRLVERLFPERGGEKEENLRLLGRLFVMPFEMQRHGPYVNLMKYLKETAGWTEEDWKAYNEGVNLEYARRHRMKEEGVNYLEEIEPFIKWFYQENDKSPPIQ